MKLVECPRDAMQGFSRLIPTSEKVEYLNLLLEVGFDTLDFGSFVSPKAIPQMADTEAVLEALAPQKGRNRFLVIAANHHGVRAAAKLRQWRNSWNTPRFCVTRANPLWCISAWPLATRMGSHTMLKRSRTGFTKCIRRYRPKPFPSAILWPWPLQIILLPWWKLVGASAPTHNWACTCMFLPGIPCGLGWFKQGGQVGFGDSIPPCLVLADVRWLKTKCAAICPQKA